LADPVELAEQLDISLSSSSLGIVHDRSQANSRWVGSVNHSVYVLPSRAQAIDAACPRVVFQDCFRRVARPMRVPERDDLPADKSTEAERVL